MLIIFTGKMMNKCALSSLRNDQEEWTSSGFKE